MAAIIGAGLIGRAWAMVFARAGWRARWYADPPTRLDLARGHILTSLTQQQEVGLLDDARATGSPTLSLARLKCAMQRGKTTGSAR